MGSGVARGIEFRWTGRLILFAAFDSIPLANDLMRMRFTFHECA